MKRKIFIILFCFICVIIYADENYYFMENILINRGYTKFDTLIIGTFLGHCFAFRNFDGLFYGLE
jgi:ABC-type iron transport system FetAB permease component